LYLWLIIGKTPAYFEICPFSVNYETVIFYNAHGQMI
jgi:hypothetical protein